MSNLKLPNLSYQAMRNTNPGTIAYATTMAHTREGEGPIRVHLMHHGNTIAILTPESVTVDNCGYDTPTTSNRIHRILYDNGIPVRCHIKNGTMVLTGYDGTQTSNFPVTFNL